MAEITIKSVEGNPLNINVVMTAVEHSMLNGEIVTETVDFYPDTSKPVRAYLDCTTARKQFCPTTYVDGNIVYLSCDNATAGVYTLTITCTDTNGKARRYKSDACIEVYDLTSAAEIAGSFDEQTYEMNGVFYTFGGQSDWDETNPESPAYILNKPDLSDYATDEELQAVEEQIPNVPEWAMQPQKPTYTPQEVGAASASQMTAEQTARQQADTTLQNNINAEKTARENADTKITTLLLGKQDVIQDLETIRSGAEKGATSVQPSDIVDSRGVFDLSAHNAVNGQLATYANLSAALVALNALELKYKYGGMSFKFVQSSDNKYVQYRLMTTSFSTDEANWQGVDDEPTAGSDNLVESGGVFNALFSNFLDSKNYTDELVQTQNAEYKNISLTQQYISGYAETDGVFKSIGSSVDFGFHYVRVLKGHIYRMTGTYQISSIGYANILFSDILPSTDSVGLVIESGKGSGTTFDVTFTAPSDGYLLIWSSSKTVYRYNFYDYVKKSLITTLQKEDVNIKTAIDYEESNEYVTESTFVKGACTSNRNKFEYRPNVKYGYYAYELLKGVKYNISGTFVGGNTGYAGIVFLETLPSGDVNLDIMCIELEQYVSKADFNIDYTPDSNGYVMIWTTSGITISYKVPKKTTLTYSELYKDSFIEPLKIVGQGLYKPLYVQTSNNKIVSAPSNYSFAIPVLAGEKYLVRGKSKVYAQYAVVSFATSLEAGTIATIYVTASQEQNLFPINYVFTAPNNGYLIIWASSGNSYESQNYIEVCKYIYGQDKIYDYYLPTSLTIQTFGDSITDNSWGDHSSWVNYIEDNIHDVNLTIINSGIGGSTVYGLPSIVENGGTNAGGESVLGLQSTAELVVIFIGTNDWSAGRLLSEASASLATVFQYITEHSKAKILFCTPLQRYNTSDQSRDTNSYGEPLNSENISLREFCDGLIEVCKRYSVPVLNLNAEAGINRYNIFDYAVDGLHPHRDGDIYVSNLICKKIKEMIRGSI